MLKQIIFIAAFFCMISANAAVIKNYDFSKSAKGWETPKYWAGKTGFITENGKTYMELVSGSRGKEIFGRSLGGILNSKLFGGTKIKFTIEVKGNGNFQAGLLTYSYKSGEPKYQRGATKPLTAEFSTYTETIELTKHCRMVRFYLEIPGSGKAVIKSIKVERLEDKDLSITVPYQFQVVKNAADAEAVTFKTNRPNSDFYFCQRNNKDSVDKIVKSDAAGNIKIKVQPQDSGMLELSVAGGGKSALTSICVENEKKFAATDAIARTIKLAKPLKVLFIADSLTDFYRGYNYVDRLNFWMNKYNPGKFSFRNAGVGGDFTSRVLKRLRGTLPKKPKAYRQNMYDRLFDEKYDIIFIFLGQNDTRSKRTDNFSKPLISPAQQEKDLREIFKFIAARSKAKIVLLAPSPSYAKVFEERHQKWPASRQIHMYGKKELVDGFDAVNRKLCKEYGFDYIDTLSAMRGAADLKSLYVIDGVHLSPEGGRIVADEILKYLKK